MEIKIKTDSRKVVPGDTFIAIQGNNFDGHAFIEEAIKNGATTIITEKIIKKSNINIVKVRNTKKYLTKMLVKKYATYFDDLKIIGITGTNGKTTTAYMTYQLLQKLNIKAAYIGTIGFYYNNKYESSPNTTPDILNFYNWLFKAKDSGCQIVIIEASSIGLKEKRLAGIKFHSAVFTNLTHDHLDYHHTMKKYLNAKKLLFKAVKRNGKRIVNIDDSYYKHFTNKKNTFTYGFTKADIYCLKHDKSFENFTYHYNNKTYTIKSPLLGKYNVYNVLASIAILLDLNIDINKINDIYPTLSSPQGRMNIINYHTNKIIIDYAHTPDAMKQIITTVSKLQHNNLYIIFGCPGERDRLKRPIMAKLANKYSNYFIITNDDPHYEDENQIVNDIVSKLHSKKYTVILDRKKAITKGINLLKNNDILLILGKGHEDYIIIKDKKIPHNDSDFVRDIITKK